MAFSLEDVRNIHAIGRNYVKHIEELGNEMPTEPVLFSKSPSCLVTGPLVRLPLALAPIHHELELVLRLGEDVAVGTYSGLHCISHVALGIDFTARTKQDFLKSKGLPWHLAKNFRDSAYVSSFTDRFDLNAACLFQLHINGKLRQDANSSLMIWSFDRFLGILNRTIPLKKGDLIYTGTPEGVGPVLEGDVLTLSSETLGLEAQFTAVHG